MFIVNKIPIAFTNASTNMNKLFNKVVVFKKTLLVAKLVKSSTKLTEFKDCAQDGITGIKSKAQIQTTIILYKSNFQKTEKFAINNFKEFLNIINKSPY